MSFVLYVIAGALAATRPEAAAIIEGAAETYVPVVPNFAQVINLIVTDVLGEQRARELRARGAGMDWDQAVAYRLTQTTQALGDLESATQPGARWRFKQRIPPAGAPGRAQFPERAGRCCDQPREGRLTGIRIFVS